MTTPNRGLVNSVENTLQPGVAFNWLADILDRRFGALTIDFAADATLELTQIQSDYSVLVFTDTGPVLTGPQDVEFPAAFPSVLVVNNTAQVLTMLKSGGTGVAVPVGASMRVSCGVTDVLSQTGAAAWGGITGTLPAQTDLQAALDAKLALAGGALSGTLNEAKGTDIASAGTTNIASATGNLVHITGTTTINALGTAQAGARRVLVFDGALLLTHDATSLILPTGANITTAAGDTATMLSEGSGNWRCTSYQRKDGTALAGSGGGLTNFTEAVNTSTPNATTPVVTLTATNAATDVDAAMISKGAGAFLLNVPDNTTTGGNKRGSRAVDLQTARSASSQVASGSNSAIVAGSSNTASGAGAAVIAGAANLASGNNSLATGNENTASGENSIAHGRGADTRTVANSRAGSSHAIGFPQFLEVPLGALTTNATPTVLTSDTSAAATTNQFVIPNGASMLRVQVSAHHASNSDCAGWDIPVLIKNIGGTVSIVGTPVVTQAFGDAGASAWAVALSANSTLDCLTITVTGAAATNIYWSARVIGPHAA